MNLRSIFLGFVVLAIMVGASSCGGGAAVSAAPDPSSGSGNDPIQQLTSFFDSKGSTAAFGIPTGMTGTVSAGQEVFNANCTVCHGSGSGLPALNYTQFKARLATPPMNSLSLTEQQIVDVVAWLNRNTTPPPGGSGGSGGNGGSGGTVSPGTDDNGADDDVSGSDDDMSGGSDDTADDGSTDSDIGDDSGTAGSDDASTDSAAGGEEAAGGDDDSSGENSGSDDAQGSDSDSDD